jgi:SIR2-like domain
LSKVGDLTPQEIAGEIWEVMKFEKCVCWVGSGLSNLFYKDWPETVSCLCRSCGVPLWSDSGGKPSADLLIDKAEECKQADLKGYEATLANLFGDEVVPTRQAFSWLIKAPFKAYVTTNFDPLLSEAAAVLGYRSVHSYPLLPLDRLALDKKPLFYAHGHARRGGAPTGHDLVLARSDFHEAYAAGTARTFFEALLLTYPIVFVGCRLLEPDIRQQLLRVHDMHTRIKQSFPNFEPPSRLAIVPARYHEERTSDDPPPKSSKRRRSVAEEREEVERFRALDTVVLRYVPGDPHVHGEIEGILKETCRISETAPILDEGKITLR